MEAEPEFTFKNCIFDSNDQKLLAKTYSSTFINCMFLQKYTIDRFDTFEKLEIKFDSKPDEDPHVENIEINSLFEDSTFIFSYNNFNSIYRKMITINPEDNFEGRFEIIKSNNSQTDTEY